jgi:hypothetical protein
MRSLQADDYQDVPRPVAVMAKDFASGSTTGRHSHLRAQLLYATAGLMVATTENGTWVVPAGHALLIPPGVVHDVAMHGAVAMRTAYLTVTALAGPLSVCRVLRVSALLDAALVALSDEPVLYDPAGRGGHLAALVLDELTRAPDTPFALPLPRSSPCGDDTTGAGRPGVQDCGCRRVREPAGVSNHGAADHGSICVKAINFGPNAGMLAVRPHRDGETADSGYSPRLDRP